MESPRSVNPPKLQCEFGISATRLYVTCVTAAPGSVEYVVETQSPDLNFPAVTSTGEWTAGDGDGDRGQQGGREARHRVAGTAVAQRYLHDTPTGFGNKMNVKERKLRQKVSHQIIFITSPNNPTKSRPNSLNDQMKIVVHNWLLSSATYWWLRGNNGQ